MLGQKMANERSGNTMGELKLFFMLGSLADLGDAVPQPPGIYRFVLAPSKEE